MTWVRLDETFAAEGDIVAAGPLAMALHVAALCYINTHLTDGHVPRVIARRRLIDFEFEIAPDQVVEVDPDHVIGALLATGRWQQVEGGYRVDDPNQPTREQVLELQQKKADAGRKGGQARAAARAQADGKQPPSTSQARASAVPDQAASKTQARSVPVRTVVPLAPDGANGSHGDRDNPPTLTVIDGHAGEPDPPPAAAPVTAQTLLAEHLQALEHRPPKRVIGHLSSETKKLLDEGIDPGAVRGGLEILRDRGLDPSKLPSTTNQALNPPRPRASPGRLGKAQRQLAETLNTAAAMQRMGPPGGGIADDLGGLDADRDQAQRALAGPADQRRDRGRVVDGAASVLGR